MRKIRHEKNIIIIFLLLIICEMFLTSCIPVVELNKRGLIESIAIDYKDGKFISSFQMFNSSASIGANGAESQGDNFIVKSEGKTIMESMKRTSLKQDRRLYYRVTNVIILGREIFLDRKIYKQTIDFLNKTYMDSPNVYVVMANKEASDIIEADIEQSDVQSNFVLDTLKNAEKQSYIKKVHLEDIVMSLDDFNTAAIIPVIKKNEIEDDKEELQIKGIGVIKDGLLRGIISEDDVKYIRLLDNKKSKLTFSLLTKRYGRCDFSVLKKDVKIKSKIENNKINFYIDLKLKSALMENEMGCNINDLSVEDIKVLELDQNEYFRSNISKLLKKLLKEYKADILYFTNDVYRDNYDFWRENKDRWNNVLEEAAVFIKVETDVFKSSVEKSKDY